MSAFWLLAIVVGAACSKPPAEVGDVGTADAAVRDRSPSYSECLAAASVKECEALGCLALDVQLHEYTAEEGCREIDGFICLNQADGPARAGYYWREREDGVFVTWSFGAMVLPSFSFTWKKCRSTFHPACECNRTWPSYLSPDMGADGGGGADAGDPPNVGTASDAGVDASDASSG